MSSGRPPGEGDTDERAKRQQTDVEVPTLLLFSPAEGRFCLPHMSPRNLVHPRYIESRYLSRYPDHESHTRPDRKAEDLEIVSMRDVAHFKSMSEYNKGKPGTPILHEGSWS